MDNQLSLPADLQALEQLPDFLRSFLPVDDEQQTQIILAVHELCVNIIQHGYNGSAGEIRLKGENTVSQFRLVIEDDATHLSFMLPDTVDSPDPLSMPEKGWGLYIIQQTMDDFYHEHHKTGNRWFLRKNW